MPNKPKSENEHISDQASLTISAEDMPAKKARIEELKAREEMRKNYGDGLPYDRDRCIAMAKDKLKNVADNAVAFGKYLIWIEAEENFQALGKPLAQILREYFPDLSQATAYNFIRLAKCSVDNPYFYESVLHKSKQIILLEALSEEDIKELEQGGIVAGIKLDEIDRTPWRELKTKARAYKKQIEIGTEQIRQRDAKIAELEKKLHDMENPVPYSSEDQRQLNNMMLFRQRFDVLLLDTMQIPRKRGNETAVQNLYFLYAWMAWQSSERMYKIREEYPDFESFPWEFSADEIPPIFADIAKVIESAALKNAEKRLAKNG